MNQCAECDDAVAEYLRLHPAYSEAVNRSGGLPSREHVTRIRLAQSGLPEAYTSGSRGLADLPASTSDAVSICDLLGSSVQGAYLWGPVGAFKTSVAAAWLADRIRRGASGLYRFVPKLLDEITASYDDSAREKLAAIVAKLSETPILVLDDLGKEKPSEHSSRIVMQILDGRYTREGGILVVVSNESQDELCAKYHESYASAILRRLAELTVSVPMERAA